MRRGLGPRLLGVLLLVGVIGGAVTPMREVSEPPSFVTTPDVGPASPRPTITEIYAAPVGTPVRAVADGVIEAAGWSGGNGISVTVRHAQNYRSMYNHLSQVRVKVGQHVRQRDVIGRVGSTGLSTGPHLDYRVSKDGRFVNPLAERFIPGAPVPSPRQAAFRAHLRAMLDRLDRHAAGS